MSIRVWPAGNSTLGTRQAHHSHCDIKLWASSTHGARRLEIAEGSCRGMREKPRNRRPAPAPSAAPAPAPKKAKLSYKEQRELEGLPARIEGLEAEQKALGELLAGTAIYSGDAQVLTQTQARFSQIENELMEALERWEILSNR